MLLPAGTHCYLNDTFSRCGKTIRVEIVGRQRYSSTVRYWVRNLQRPNDPPRLVRAESLSFVWPRWPASAVDYFSCVRITSFEELKREFTAWRKEHPYSDENCGWPTQTPWPCERLAHGEETHPFRSKTRDVQEG